ncbi:MAG: cell division protein FtsL [SAR324 cluster bacterium]|nr:cell division protein FtsL [SAR324 cluster bacterium]
MNIFQRKSHMIRRQHKWWKFAKDWFSPQHSFRLVIVAAVLITVGSLSYIGQWANYLQLGYRTQTLIKEKTALEKKIALLEIEVSFLTRLERLDRIATTQMDMHPPSPAQRLILFSKNTDENE